MSAPAAVKATLKESQDVLEKAGDYVVMYVANKKSVVLLCPICSKPVVANKHDFVTVTPIHIEPEVECETGCVFHIRKGEFIFKGRPDKY